MDKVGKCQSCGDITALLSYNGSDSCSKCLGMDRKGVSRNDIIKEIRSIQNGRLRKSWKTDRKARR